MKLASKFAYVYTPPGYETSKDRYPVLYLTCDQTSQWMQPGFRVPTILDNLIAEGKAKPMIVVVAATIPNEAVDEAKLDDDPLPETIGLPSRFSADLNPHGGMLTLPPYLDGGTSVATDLVPFIDQRYRTIADRERRAIVGISAPGAAAFYAAATNPQVFAWVALVLVSAGRRSRESGWTFPRQRMPRRGSAMVDQIFARTWTSLSWLRCCQT